LRRWIPLHQTIALLALYSAALPAGSVDEPVQALPGAPPQTVPGVPGQPLVNAPTTLTLPAPTVDPAGAGAGGAAGGAMIRPMSVDLGPDLQGPYEVKQLETLGREKIKGQVCELADGFDVTFETPPAAFKMHFKPDIVAARSIKSVPLHGTVAYQYSIPRAGETHDATGLYGLAADSAAHRIHVAIEVKDHVRFKGYDGVPKTRYRFDLVPMPGATCP
jgi:hypothetical protein